MASAVVRMHCSKSATNTSSCASRRRDELYGVDMPSRSAGRTEVSIIRRVSPPCPAVQTRQNIIGAAWPSRLTFQTRSSKHDLIG
eukprot:1981886-Prymnesium_polylepis.2